MKNKICGIEFFEMSYKTIYNYFSDLNKKILYYQIVKEVAIKKMQSYSTRV